MSEITPLSSQSPSIQPVNGRRLGFGNVQPVSITAGQGDSVEFSQMAQLLARLDSMPDVRQSLVDRVKSEIAAGTYVTPDKIEGAISNMVPDLGD